MELANQSVPINKIPKSSVDSVMRVLVIRRGFVIPYKNSRHEGTFRMIILVDEEETEHEVPIEKFSYGFSSLEHADKLPNGAILGNYPHDLTLIFFPHYVIVMTNRHDLFPNMICVLVSVNPLIENENSKRREILVTNELMEHTIVTLWEDFIGNDGALLEKLQEDKPILALCDVRISIYKGIDSVLYLFINYKLTIVVVSKCLNGPATLGRFGISTIPVSNVLINPMFQKPNDLRA
uniref:Uncharacterized protein n=1 Tax=Solanum tuberosum TaxID=4113 RepID=M1DSE5_SOLTU